MENYPNLPSHIEIASYKEQKIPQFKGNPLISALPMMPDDDQLEDSLFDLPDFDPTQRNWENYERIYMVESLANFMLPLPRHVQLARAIDALIRNGYVGRIPRDTHHIATFNKIYSAEKAGKAISSGPVQHRSQFTRALIGPSGLGKTSTVKRICGRFQKCIYHPALDIFQVPSLHIEAPYDGMTIKGLAHSIIREVDERVPDGRYYERYVEKQSRAGNETLLNHCARVMHMHFVGLLVVDEIQNLENAGTGNQKLMSALVAASNELGVPILFIGTNKARKILALDFRQGRRSTGPGFHYMGQLKCSGLLSAPDEWEDFLSALWTFQWVRKPIELNDHLSRLMYYYCQGIIDIAIKLFACAQWRAILDGTETITAQVLDLCANNELGIVVPMIEALRRDDSEALETYGDIAPIDFGKLVDNTLNRYEGLRNRKAAIRSGDCEFAPTIINALVAVGVDDVRAEAIASSIETEAKALNVIDGVKAAMDTLSPLPRKKTRSKAVPSSLPTTLAPNDYRRASSEAQRIGTTAFDQLCKTGAACDIGKALNLE